mmetsp:Transcript_15709/g.36321  ORF Transcript_15709/g.36321 Transcript_15709/m.36321 type:complete len:207 (+) Transcript_15709:3054-3674(+)
MNALAKNLVGIAQHVVVEIVLGVAIGFFRQVRQLPNDDWSLGIEGAAHQVGIVRGPGQSHGVQAVPATELDSDPMLERAGSRLEVPPCDHCPCSARLWLQGVDANHGVVASAGQVLSVVGKPDREDGGPGVGGQGTEQPVLVCDFVVVVVVVVAAAVGIRRGGRMRLLLWWFTVCTRSLAFPSDDVREIAHRIRRLVRFRRRFRAR